MAEKNRRSSKKSAPRTPLNRERVLVAALEVAEAVLQAAATGAQVSLGPRR